MLSDKKRVKQNSENVYQAISHLLRCKFIDLQVECKLESTELYMALIYLLQQERIRQEWTQDGIYYCI